ncbi:hypothetical protein, partial [Agrobacterium tumefaciens]|uniref:hypothetical protein n=1 Tax=Agrobacterium tumefaciens TaxID=358 RepID=UPI001BAC2893
KTSMGEMTVAHDIRYRLKANQQITADGLRRRVTLKGKDMHQTSLMSSVFKLIQISRNLELEQVERDAAATLATGLANAAIKAHGPNSEFSVTLMSGIESLFDKRH